MRYFRAVIDALASYVDQEGHDPPQADPEYAWQWSYTGTKSEKELLLDLIQDECEHEQMSLC